MRASSANRYSAEDLGSIKNHLGFLSSDLARLRPRRFMETTGLNPTSLSRIFGIQRTTAYRDEIPIPKEIKQSLIELVIATDIAYGLMGKDLAQTVRWLMSPNTMTFGDVPFDVIMRGNGKELIAWLASRAGLTPGAAF
ncbi:MAG: hypothetical protein HY537_00630 [Deltaproteobacteria bacterium]|nr:hypothetical protein [Deltaproteobacteria bacterium]